MSNRKDLTRWNRAGLARFTYVDGNAVEYLESLRRELATRFQDTAWLSPREPEPADETPQDGETLADEQKRVQKRQQRILRAYFGERRDWAWEISRTFARACHMLTGYADAWANEGYLGTATQWDNVRRLVGLLGYSPAPPASATTLLVLFAKNGVSGKVAKGFQVKNAPPMGAEKVTFETLYDLVVDDALNELRPKGWNKCPEASATPPADFTPQQRQFSSIAKQPLTAIQDLGDKRAAAFGSIDAIYKLYDVHPNDLAWTKIGNEWLWEFKAKATAICDFEPGSEWEAILDWTLPAIVQESAAALAEKTGNDVDQSQALQVTAAMMGACLDHGIYATARLGDFVTGNTSNASQQGLWLTAWRTNNKPRVVPGQVALVYRADNDLAEAVTIGKINPPDAVIEVVPGEAPPKWHEWPRGEAILRVAPRWKRKCWLNGGNVIRTRTPHGLAAGSYICWKGEKDGYGYATVLKADRQSLWLDTFEKGKQRPKPGDEIMVAVPINSNVMSTALEAINKAAADATVKSVEMGLPPAKPLPFTVYKPFQPKKPGAANPSGGGGGGLLPPASVPGLGSFLFPSPLLPIDLVKLAVELLLSMGMMVIPSTGMPVFKGMPFGPSLDGAEDAKTAASALVTMLDNMVLPTVWGDDGLLIDTQKNPVYLELTADIFNQVTDPNAHLGTLKIVDTSGQTLANNEVSVVNGKACKKNTSEAVGFQPHCANLGLGATPPADRSYAMKMVAWAGSSPGHDLPASAKKASIASSIQNPVNNPAEGAAAIFQSIQRDNTGTVNGAFPEPLLAVLKGAPVVRGVVATPAPAYVFDGVPEPLESGDWVVGEFENRAIRALHISSIDDYDTGSAEKAFSLSFADVPKDVGPLKTVHGAFRAEIASNDAQINRTLLDSTIELDAIPESLTAGRKVLLLGKGKTPVAARVARVEGNKLTTDPSPAGYAAGDLIICGNVVEAGHGVAKPPVILGSGDAARTNQEFTLGVSGVSFTPDSTMRAGVAAAVELEVAGRIWQQVDSLKDSGPGDHHYAIRMTEEGYLRFVFGDGQNGRRLPTGRNNLRVRYRVGCGLAGNLPAHSLESPVNSHPLIRSVIQPEIAAGGGEMETIASLRNSAPATLLALERAVSLSDFADLAKGRSNIWQATARTEIVNTGRAERVIVTIVPAGGSASDEMVEQVRQSLQAHALPGVQVIVERFTPGPAFSLDIRISVRSSAFLPEEVIRNVAKAVTWHFRLENRRLGVGLFLSEVYQVVEAVTGVENSVCVLTVNGTHAQVIDAGDAQTVVCLDPRSLRVEHVEYAP